MTDQVNEAVAWYVEVVAPGMRDNGTRIGPWFSKAEAEGWVSGSNVLRPLYTHPSRGVVDEAMVERAMNADAEEYGASIPASRVRRILEAAALAAVPEPLSADDVQWIVNDSSELGVMIRGQCFFLYKGDSLVYEDAKHDDGRPMFIRTVGKREFGECCYPIGDDMSACGYPHRWGEVSLGDSDRWQPMLAATPAHDQPDGEG